MNIDGMKVSKPKRVKFEEVERLLRTKANWIYKHYMEFQKVKSEQPKREWKSGEEILYMGNSYNIEIFAYNGRKTSVNFNGEKFEVYVNKDLSEEDRKLSIETQFKKWFINCARENIEERLEFYCLKMGLNFNRFTIREQKTRWGSCSKKGNLNFNWKLIMAPKWVMDYVVIHELCHLKFLNHSKEYWNMVGLFMPEYRNAQIWLKKNGMKLVI
jgi:predicted metal-dependent hydrolase